MTEKEALLFFPHSTEDDLNELWEERLFEQKQFFLTRPPIAKVFGGRMKKLEKQYNAFLFLSGELDKVKSMDAPHFKYTFSENLIEAFNEYHESRNQFKHEVLKSIDYNTLKKVIDSWMEFEKSYSMKWSNPESLDDEIDIIKSKEPDPMIVLDRLKKVLNDKNIKTFDNLKTQYNVLDEVIRKEVKRLTLLTKE